MTASRKKGELSSAAKTEFYRILAERNIRKDIFEDDNKFLEYLERVSVSSKAMEFGKFTEAEARAFYELNTGAKVEECGFIISDDEQIWGDSPDGLIYNGAFIDGCIEIKCPKPATFQEYVSRLNSGETLKDIESKYYWQVVNHLAVSKAEWCDFILYEPMSCNGFKVVRFTAEELSEDISALAAKISEFKALIIQE